MDTKTQLSRNNLLAGYRQVVRGLTGGRLKYVVIASDTDSGMKEELIALCRDKNVPCRMGDTRAETGKMLGLDVACAVYGETEDNN
ncbi:MAG TPA: ribosomal L7Ae/L30e/S12e/Gadd45 family protein [Clostridia bacterium]|nr:ribosomal L7Ae/L30e/S12e/Gadd45 family protein [Clostridia bacterium]